jgi:hypothetical protein
MYWKEVVDERVSEQSIETISTKHTVRAIKARRVGWVGYVAHTGKMRNSDNFSLKT